MYGRVTWYTAPGERADAGIEGFKRLLPQLQQLPGYLGSALLVDRDAGEAATIVYYRDQKAVSESRDIVSKMRSETNRETGVQSTRIEEYEITSMQRAQAGTTGKWGRLITGTLDLSHAEEVRKLVEEKTVPALMQQPGFRSFVGGINRENGAAFTGTTFDTREQLEASNAAVQANRDQIRESGQTKDVKAQVFEIAVADVTATSGVNV